MGSALAPRDFFLLFLISFFFPLSYLHSITSSVQEHLRLPCVSPSGQVPSCSLRVLQTLAQGLAVHTTSGHHAIREAAHSWVCVDRTGTWFRRETERCSLPDFRTLSPTSGPLSLLHKGFQVLDLREGTKRGEYLAIFPKRCAAIRCPGASFLHTGRLPKSHQQFAKRHSAKLSTFCSMKYIILANGHLKSSVT